MLNKVALLLCFFFIWYLFRSDKTQSKGVSKATWIPLIWMSIAGSRFVSNWLHPGTTVSASTFSEGSPIDRAVFLFLIIAGVLVLKKRKVSWKALYKSNPWVWFYFLFGLVSVVWSDLPFVALKRWGKGLGNVIMVMVLLTEAEPYKAVENVLRKLAFILVPSSVLLVKYFPNLGRAYHMGLPMATGVATHKNTLGAVCLASGIYFCWMFLYGKVERAGLAGKIRILLYSAIAIMIVWLFYKADSATSLFSMVVALVILSLSRIPPLRQNLRKTILCIMVLFGIVFAAEMTFGLKDKVIVLLGREPSLTTRVPMWKDLISMVHNPVLGYGYDSFWMGDRQRIIGEKWAIRGNAHNGYLEMYLNLGLVGVSFILAWIVSGLRRIWLQANFDFSVGVLRLAFLFIAAIYSYTEAAFYGVSLVWVLLLLGIMDPPEQARLVSNE